MKSSGRIFFFLLLAAFLISTAYSQQYWLRQPSPTNKWLTKCTFTDSLYGWVTGDSGIVIHTSNGGVSWTVQDSQAGANPINDVFFLNRRLGWALANDFSFHGTFVLKTTDGGQTWNSARFTDSTLILKAVFYTDSLTGFMGDFAGRILRTSNGGLNWSMSLIDSGICFSFSINKINFLNSLTGYMCGGHMDIVGEVWKTTNGGFNWKPFCLTPESLMDIKFINGRVIATGGDFEYGAITVQTSNEGSTWNYVSDSCYGVGQTLAFRTSSEVWVPLGFSGLWAVSNDSGIGRSWHTIPVPDTASIYAAQFNSPTNGWAFGTGGSIYKYNTGIIGIINNQNNAPFTPALYQNYPNPFNPSTLIKFYLVKSEKVKLRLFDILGKEIKVLIDGNIEKGIHLVNLDAGNLPSGVYFYRLDAGAYTESKKMVLMK